MRTLAPVTLTVSLFLLAGEASAHIQLISPAQRHTDQKVGPCGVGPNDQRGPNVTTFAPGEKIVVSFDEHVNHPGHFRISFDEDGFDGFADPASYDEMYTNEYVLMDGIADKDGGIYEVEVQLPNIECDNCTLQVIQVMTDKPPYEIGTNDLYYQCADLRLEGEVMGTTDAPGTTGGESTGDDPGTTGDAEVTSEPETTAGPTGNVSDGESSGAPDPSGDDPTTAGATEPDATATATATDASAGTDPVTDGDPGTTPMKEDGCGCRSGGPGASGLLALVVVPLLRRRRRG